MSKAERPDPDPLLAQLKRGEAEVTRDKRKIFFRNVSGEGTCAMLQSAPQKQSDGFLQVAIASKTKSQ